MHGGSVVVALPSGSGAGRPSSMGAQAPASSKAWQQAEQRQWGRLPNIFWRAPTMEQLRASPSFEALPPVERVALAGPASHRYVRQDHPLWDELHEGVLTTGVVRGALGLYEKAAAKKIGIPNGRAGHRELLQAYHRLHQSCNGGSTTSSSMPGIAEAAAAAAHNAAAVVAFNASKSCPDNGGAAGGGAAAPVAAGREQDVRQDQGTCADCSTTAAAAPATGGKSRHAKKRQRKKQDKAAMAAAAPPGGVAAAVAGGIQEEYKLRKARALSSLGLLSICCSWGSAQEAASLMQVASAFPGSQLAEVGLCRLQQELLPPAWGFGPGSLPPIGASPDALIRHCLTATAPVTKAAAGSRPRSGPGAEAGGDAALQVRSPPVQAQDISGLLARLQLAGSNGTSSSSTSGGAIGDCSPSGSTGNGSSSSSSSIVNGVSSAGCGYLIEVVEVKNTCPFGHCRRAGRLRTSEFAIADRGPRQAVPPEWVPQLQLHMLCTGTPSGLLVSRSATKGSRIFRLRRDDELLRLMLLVINRLWQQHVLPGQPPPHDVFASWHVHHDMLRRIGEAARAAELVAVLAEGQHLPGGDPRWFLD